MPKASDSLRTFSEKLANLPEFPKSSETLSVLRNLMVCKSNGKNWKILEKIGNGPKWFNISENLRECLEIFGKLRKQFKSVFQMFFMIF